LSGGQPAAIETPTSADAGGTAGGRVVGAPGAMLVIISGPSGVGKDTILRLLKERFTDPRRRFVVTYKTRERRKGEVDGVDYHFVSEDEFRRLLAEGAFLEVAEVHGHWSGTPVDQVVSALREGKDAILKIDVQGAQTVKSRVPAALLIFVAPPSMEALSGRLKGRATETQAEFERRQRDAAIELARQHDYDYVVVNETGQAERTARRILDILESEHAAHPDRHITI
jgi:guanylate kinase